MQTTHRHKRHTKDNHLTIALALDPRTHAPHNRISSGNSNWITKTLDVHILMQVKVTKTPKRSHKDKGKHSDGNSHKSMDHWIKAPLVLNFFILNYESYITW